MKKMIFALAALLMMAVSAQAMGYEQARRQALFLTDKMAYELNLTDDQYEAAYEINLDYLMGVNVESDLYGIYWERRNLDLSYILFDWQYRAYLAASYFYRPLYWRAGYWHFGIYARYPHRDYFFFGRPHFYNVYRGGHSWHSNGGRSWYHGREFGRPRPGNDRGGMRDHFDRGDYGRGQNMGHSNGGNNRTFGNRNQNAGHNGATGQDRNGFGNRNGGSNGSVGGSQGNGGGNNRFGRSGNGQGVRESSTRTTAPSASPSTTRPSSSPRSIGRRFGGTSGNSIVNSRPSGSTSSSVTHRPSTSAPSRSVSTPSRSISTPSRPSSPSTSSRSVSPSRSSGSSFGGSRGSAPSRSSGSSSGRSGGTSHFGGRR
ncbi:MAG: hypothetical protein IJM81_06420 [Prevotella sp.]|nr:hypothetical protein [Prevotella sp.]